MKPPVRRAGDLDLGHVVLAAGVELESTIAIRHTYNPDGLQGPQDLEPEKVHAYTRRQGLRKFPTDPPACWLVFITDGGLRSRFLTAYENRGEVDAERTATDRYFDLQPSDLLVTLRDRLVIQWSRDAVNWVKRGTAAAQFTILEIADPAEVAFPDFDKVVIDFPTLLEVVESSRYRAWRTALASVQGIYLITDSRTGRHYVGKADGAERILGRWASYARTGHGGNAALIDLAGLDLAHTRDFRFSILRVFGPDTPKIDVDAAELHYKRALMTREFGYNRN
ncbi:GIY-YIG nuclease family protein [Promicromonospora sp. CA-289599]|uniref:GIY-YIG nuclease family protein n=1 Tax=Promicromonospora sp. CA-289599 TaxID=3240014 RepID=UPI003D8C44EA